MSHRVWALFRTIHTSNNQIQHPGGLRQDYRQHLRSQGSIDFYGNSSFISLDPTPASETPQQQRPPSPGGRPIFEFISPFDALSNPPATQQQKRKPVPTQPSSAPSTSDQVSSWTAVSMDPKCKFVENLMDQLTRGQGSLPPPAQSVTAQFDPMLLRRTLLRSLNQPGRDPCHHSSLSRAHLCLVHRLPSQSRRLVSSDGPAGMGNYQSGPKDNNQHVPGSFRQEPCAKNQVMKGKTTTNIVQQTIIFDVSQPLDEVQAPHDTVKSTAIALVKVDSTFLPRSTIGATHWVAYRMSKGRVRVISRSSSDRTLLQLPPLFPTSVTVRGTDWRV
ncbi:hypothetical protein BC835DRAFT_1470757 [Cytidiella melzeri]|nr:hypothetical protein BC835DRAFT_1470757 [Cytidiella melzeri]